MSQEPKLYIIEKWERAWFSEEHARAAGTALWESVDGEELEVTCVGPDEGYLWRDKECVGIVCRYLRQGRTPSRLYDPGLNLDPFKGGGWGLILALTLLLTCDGLCADKPVSPTQPTWAYSYALEVRSRLEAQGRYCYHKEHWESLDRSIKEGQNIIELRVCHINGGRYKYRVVASGLDRVRDEYGDRLVWGEDVRSRVVWE